MYRVGSQVHFPGQLIHTSQRGTMSLHRVECVVKGGALIGEGPVWEESHQTLMFVDIAGKKLHRWNPAANQIETLETGVLLIEVSHWTLGSSQLPAFYLCLSVIYRLNLAVTL